MSIIRNLILYCYLITFPSICLAQEKRELNAAILEYKFEDPQKIVQILSSKFCKNYSKDHEISKFQSFRSIKSNGKYIDFKAGKGFYLSKKYDTKSKEGESPMIYYINQLSSLSYNTDGKELLKADMNKEKYPSLYSNLMFYDISVIIKMITYFSPINIAQYQNFKYTFTNKNGVIHFKSIENKKSGYCKLKAEGDLYFDVSTMTLSKILFTTFEPFIWFKNGTYVHSNYLVVEFNNNTNSYLSSVFYHRKWDSETNGINRFLFPPTRSNPVLNKLEEFYYVKLSRPIFNMNSKMQTIDYITHKRRKDADSIFNRLSEYILKYEFSPYTPSLWDNLSNLEVGEFPLISTLNSLNINISLKNQASRYLNYEPTLDDFNKLTKMSEGSYNNYLPNYFSFITYYKDIYKKMCDLYITEE